MTPRSKAVRTITLLAVATAAPAIAFGGVTPSDRTNTLLLSLPKKVATAPLLLALHGHEGPWGEADPKAFQPGHADNFCAYFAERGWAGKPASATTVIHDAGHRVDNEAAFRWLSAAFEKRP